MTPSAPLPAGANLVGEMYYVPSHTIENDGCTTAPQADGTYKTDCSVAAVGLTDAETVALVETWTGKVVQGFSVPEWTIGAAPSEAYWETLVDIEYNMYGDI
ncbi:hypothetical protein LshimejAT787_0904790 [Lyophyllum shimeji]|uniref:Uncharacterized protein n=1 Tax=Lyophyllum shimeji TaxID=47721 RepID=A0A9P3PTJ6_LYOSH|nr:hypothetical protein LshimejAT787_0904790 [Lyophyllum shimeji]